MLGAYRRGQVREEQHRQTASAAYAFLARPVVANYGLIILCALLLVETFGTHCLPIKTSVALILLMNLALSIARFLLIRGGQGARL